jgi:hypothetical protein
VLWSQTKKCVLCVQEALISPDGNRLTATATQQTAHGYRAALLRVALPWGWYRVLYESPAGKNALPTFTQDGSGQHVIIASGSQTGWIRAGELIFLRAPASTPDFFPGITIAG